MKKVTIFIDDAVKFEIQRQAKAEDRSFAAFLRLYLRNQFALSSPSLPGSTTATDTSGGSIVVPVAPLNVYPPGLTLTHDQWHGMSDAEKTDFLAKKNAWEIKEWGLPRPTSPVVIKDYVVPGENLTCDPINPTT